MLTKSRKLYLSLFLLVLFFLIPGCAQIEIRNLIKPDTNLAEYKTFTTINQAKPEDNNYLRDEVLLDHVSGEMSGMGYSKSSLNMAKAHVTLVFNEGYEKVFVPPSAQPIISYTEGEFTTVTGKINGETVNFFGYIPPKRIESYVEIPAHDINVYKLMLRIDIYDAKNLNMLWTGTGYMESSPGKAIEDAKKMIDKLLKERLPGL